eukprot:19235_1
MVIIKKILVIIKKKKKLFYSKQRELYHKKVQENTPNSSYLRKIEKHIKSLNYYAILSTLHTWIKDTTDEELGTQQMNPMIFQKLNTKQTNYRHVSWTMICLNLEKIVRRWNNSNINQLFTQLLQAINFTGKDPKEYHKINVMLFNFVEQNMSFSDAQTYINLVEKLRNRLNEYNKDNKNNTDKKDNNNLVVKLRNRLNEYNKDNKNNTDKKDNNNLVVKLRNRLDEYNKDKKENKNGGKKGNKDNKDKKK